MANKRKNNPRSSFVIIRVSKREKRYLEEESMIENRDFSTHIRLKLGLKEEND